MSDIELYNNGKKCSFNFEHNYIYVNSMIISYGLINQLEKIEIRERISEEIKKVVTGRIFKRVSTSTFERKEYFIELLYRLTSNDDLHELTIPILESEIDNARYAVSTVNNFIDKYVEEQLEKKKEHQKLLNEKVKVIKDDDGTVYNFSAYSRGLSDSSYVLVTDDGRTYHTWLDCYRKWPPEYSKDFSCWHMISKKEAKKTYRYCKYCSDRDYDSEHFDWDSLDELDET